MTYKVAWFSAGVSSAVAIRLAINEIDEVLYIHIDDQHPDTIRFVRECEEWFGKPVKVLQHQEHTSVESILRKARFINSPYGARCTLTLKKEIRHKWEKENVDRYPFRYYWGMDASKKERKRADKIRKNMPEFHHAFPLIDRNIGKEEAHQILSASGIKRPAMYELGYHNNNCVGCVKGGMGYWNKIRVDFPDVFAARAKLEREVGASYIKGVFLDELAPDAGRHDGPIVDECGILCGVQALSMANTNLSGAASASARKTCSISDKHEREIK